MIRTSLSLLIFCLAFISCTDSSAPEFTRIEASAVFRDSISIRAIAAVNDSTVWFAANNGKIGVVEGQVPKLATVSYQDSLLAFRSIAKTSDAVFVLSIANPAVLYKIGLEGTNPTFIEDVYTETHPKVFYDAMAFWDDQNGIAMGDPTDGCLSVILTTDGGNSWNKVPCDRLPETAEGEAAFAASNTNIAVYGDTAWLVSGGKRARVFKTTDRGNSWEVYETPIVEGQAMTGIYSVSFLDANNGIIFGGNWEAKTENGGNKAVTTDGGKTWKLISDQAGPGYRSCVRYVPNTKGKGIVAVGIPGVSYSNDGGDSWIDLTEESYYNIQFVNDTTAFASGYGKIDKLVFK
ncbi:oxidoreductase [Gilvibacter sp.]|uniref:WD40/YVTN/BNR-like repeat-containing protein n=1 Tax=Gilvibacter sp. TaxID=2729997 RepID=UPI0025BC3AB7|nr:oxidoreductase [Gilvibacter sp.]NQX77844.1 oxidoreductase [Gilvibacter sp.]